MNNNIIKTRFEFKTKTSRKIANTTTGTKAILK